MKVHRDDGFPAHWKDDKDWLVDIVFVEDGDIDALHYIGRLEAYAFATNTRMLAQVGDPKGPAYELWFSFDSDERKQTFLAMVSMDEYGDSEDLEPPPPEAMMNLENLRPLPRVFPKEQDEQIEGAALAFLAAARREADSKRPGQA